MARTNDPDSTVEVRQIPQREKGAAVGKPKKIVTSSMRVAFPVGGNSIMATAGNFYSPELSTDFLKLPQSEDEKRHFYRFFYDHDPFVGQSIDLLSELPLSKIRLRKPKARNQKLADASLRFCEKWADRVGLFHRLMEIGHEWNLLGEAHIFCEDASPDMPEEIEYEYVGVIDEEGVPRREKVKRPDAEARSVAWLKKNFRGWTAIRVLPPEQVKLESFAFTDEKIVELIPDIQTRSIIERARQGDPQAIRVVDSMPQDVVEAILLGGAVPLNTDPDAGSFYFHMARKKSQYEQRGKSILQRCLRVLVFRDEVRQALSMISSRHMTPIRLIYAEDMNAEQTEDLREQVDLALQDPDFSIITNFQVTWEEMGADQRLPDWSWVYDMTDRQLYAGLGVTESVLSGESSYSGDRINLEVINIRFMLMREVLQDLVENQFFRPMCARMGFVEEDEDGNLEVVVPRLSFTRLSFRDNTETFDALFNLYQKGSLDVDTILEHLNLDPATVQEKLSRDFGTFKDATFNEVLRGLYTRIGDMLAENSNFVDKVAEQLGLNYQKPKDDSAGRF